MQMLLSAPSNKSSMSQKANTTQASFTGSNNTHEQVNADQLKGIIFSAMPLSLNQQQDSH